MIDSNDSVQSGDDNSTISSPDATPLFETNLADQIDSMFSEAAPQTESRDEETETESNPQVSEETVAETDEQETSDGDDSNTENDESTDEAAEETTAEPLVLSYEDAKDSNVKLVFRDESGQDKEWTVDELKAAVGRQSSQEKALKDVEDARLAVEADREAVAKEKVEAEMLQSAAKGAHELGAIMAEGSRLATLYNKAVTENDGNQVALLGAKLQQLKSAKDKIDNQIAQADEARFQETLNTTASELDKLGYGSLLTDEQRAGSWKEYVNKVAPGKYKDIVSSGAIAVMAEKARLWDKSQSNAKAPTKPTTIESLRGKASKNTRKPVQKKVNTDPVKSAIDEAFGF